jgi:hypothetical protein
VDNFAEPYEYLPASKMRYMQISNAIRVNASLDRPCAKATAIHQLSFARIKFPRKFDLALKEPIVEASCPVIYILLAFNSKYM